MESVPIPELVLDLLSNQNSGEAEQRERVVLIWGK